MPSTLVLDTSDPAVAEVVSQWEEGGRYSIQLTVVQGPTDPAGGTEVPFVVEEITDYGDANPPVEEEGSEMGKPMGKDAVMILIGQKKSPKGKPER